MDMDRLEPLSGKVAKPGRNVLYSKRFPFNPNMPITRIFHAPRHIYATVQAETGGIPSVALHVYV
jgi:hypothetical protein